MDNTITYLNTDLDLVSTEDLRPLAAAFEALGVSHMGLLQGHDGLWYATFELLSQDEPETNIDALLTAIEALPDAASAIWRGCSQREFNIGYDCGDKPWAFNNGLSAGLIKRMAQVDASLRITLYPDRPETESPATGE